MSLCPRHRGCGRRPDVLRSGGGRVVRGRAQHLGGASARSEEHHPDRAGEDHQDRDDNLEPQQGSPRFEGRAGEPAERTRPSAVLTDVARRQHQARIIELITEGGAELIVDEERGDIGAAVALELDAALHTQIGRRRFRSIHPTGSVDSGRGIALGQCCIHQSWIGRFPTELKLGSTLPSPLTRCNGAAACQVRYARRAERCFAARSAR